MTTIAYRNGIMAADTRAYSGGSVPIGQKNKIHRLDDGSLVGVSSTEPGMAEAFAAWLNDGANPEEAAFAGDRLKNLSALHITPEGQVFFYCENITPSGPLYSRFFAIGSGEQYALGALSSGATAEAAVKVAGLHDVWTNQDIITVPLIPQTEEIHEDVVVIEEAPEPKPRKSKEKAE